MTNQEYKVAEPDSRITVRVNGEDKELFMSAGMRTVLATICNRDLEDLSNIYLDPATQEKCMIELLVDRNERGKPSEDVSELTMMAFEMESKEADRIVKWMGDHIMCFFLKGANSINQTMTEQQKVFQSLAHSLNGMENSMEKKQSAGPSE